jgi:hypothetical protein
MNDKPLYQSAEADKWFDRYVQAVKERDAARRWAKRWKRVAKVKLEWGRKCKAALLKQRQRADDLAVQNAALRAVAMEAEVVVRAWNEGTTNGKADLERAIAAARASGALDEGGPQDAGALAESKEEGT